VSYREYNRVFGVSYRKRHFSSSNVLSYIASRLTAKESIFMAVTFLSSFLEIIISKYLACS